MKTQHPVATINYAAVINQEADRCVKCALCAPVCPTYQLTQNESESPRGRIAIAQALAQNQIPLTEVTRLRFDHCLTCRACEAVCPADVKYGDLFDHTQALLQERSPTKAIFPSLSKASLNPWLRRALRFYQRSGIQTMLRQWRFFGIERWQHQDALLPNIPKAISWQAFYPAIGHELGQVGLFLGCAGKVFDQDTLLATIKVLTQIGYGVRVPRQQQCCGALDLHAGRQQHYAQYAQKNQCAFEALPIKAVLSIASGCTAVLKEYQAHPLKPPVRDINEFLLNEPWSEDVELMPYPKKVIIHTPCTMQNVLKLPSAAQLLLARIPEIELINLPRSIGCCGAAGNYTLRFPVVSEQLLEKTLAAIPKHENTLLITTNIGCQMQLNAGLTARKMQQITLHPVALLAQQMMLKKVNES